MTVYLLLISDGLPRAAQQRRRQGRLAVNDGRAHSWQQSRRQDVDVDVDGFKVGNLVGQDPLVGGHG